MKKAFENYNFKKQEKKAPAPAPKKAPHELAYQAERLCDEINIPFSTVMLKALKTNRYITENTIRYMKEKEISSLHYFTKTFYSRLNNKYAKN